jgi:hypothetical protein
MPYSLKEIDNSIELKALVLSVVIFIGTPNLVIILS